MVVIILNVHLHILFLTLGEFWQINADRWFILDVGKRLKIISRMHTELLILSKIIIICVQWMIQ